MEKMLHRGSVQVRLHIAERRARSCLFYQASAEQYQAPVAVAVDLSSPGRVGSASSGGHNARGRDLNVTLPRPGAGAHPLTAL